MGALEAGNRPVRAEPWQDAALPYGSAWEHEWTAPTPERFSVFDLMAAAWRRKLLIGAAVVASLAGATGYLANQTPVYRATVELLIDPQALQVVGRDIIATGNSASLDFANVDSQPLVIASVGVLGRVVDALRLDQDPVFTRGLPEDIAPAIRRTAAIDALRERIVVHRVDPSLVFQITVSHPDAARAAEIANRIATEYFHESTAQRLDAARGANASLLGQTGELRGKLGEAEAAVQRFRAANGLISTGQAGLIVDQQLKDLTAQIGTAEAELARLTARSEQIRGLDSAQVLGGAIPEAVASSTIASLRAQYATADAQLSRLAATLGPRNPQLAELRQQRDAVLRLVNVEIGRLVQSASADTARAEANLKSLEARSAALTRSQLASSEAQIHLRQLESEVDATRSVYNAALDRTKELEQQQQIRTSNSRVISEAAPPLKASGPSRVLVLAAAGLFGLALGVTLAYAADLLPRRLRTAEALSRALGVRLIGTLVASQGRRRKGLLGRKAAEALPGTTGSLDAAALAGAASALRFRLGQALPATVLLVPVGETDLGRVGTALASSLTAAGQPTLLLSLDERLRTPGWASSMSDRPVSGSGRADGREDGSQLAGQVGSAPTNPPGLALIARPAAAPARHRELARAESGPEIILVWLETPDLVQTVGPAADAIVLVGSAGRASRGDARSTQDALGWLTRRVVGLVAIA